MRLVISGYYGFENLGDEAILECLIEELKGRFPECEPVVLSASPHKTAKEHGVRAIDRWDPRKILRELRGATALISGGGGLIQDQTSRRSALYYLGVIALASLRRCPVFLVGQGLGPIRNPLLYRLAGRLLSRAEFAMVRDQPSLKLLSGWGLAEDKAVLGGDLALLLWPGLQKLRVAAKGAEEGGDKAPYVAVCLKGELSERLKAALARQLDRLAEELRVVLLALHPDEDLSPMEEIAAQMNGSALVLDTAGVGLKEVLECLAGAQAVVGMRLHALIFAMLAGRPFIAISSEPKILNFLKQIEQAGGPEIPSASPAEIEEHAFELKGALNRISCDKAVWKLEHAAEALYQRTRRATDLFMERLAGLRSEARGDEP